MDFNFTNIATDQKDSGEIPVKLLIIGAGPAGFAAGLYAARADLAPVILTGMELGGQVSLTHTVENYPGFPDGVGGSELVQLFQKQAEKFGARLEYDSAAEVDLSKRPFRVKTYNAVYLAEALVVATGATPVYLNIPGETKFTGRGVSYCATCDGWFFKEKDVVVAGGGDSALEEGIFLTRYAKSVTIVHRREQLRAGAVLQNRARANPKIKFILNTTVEEILGSETVEGVRLKNKATGELSEMVADGIFIFIGHQPNTQIFSGQLDKDERGYLITDKRLHTSVEGVFAAGEAADPDFRQVITSAGMGAAAAMQAGHFLDSQTIEVVAASGAVSD